jgi:hypothetical protein
MQVKTTKIEDDKWEKHFSRTKGLVVITEGALDSIIYYMLNYMGKTEDNIKEGFWIGETEEEVDEEDGMTEAERDKETEILVEQIQLPGLKNLVNHLIDLSKTGTWHREKENETQDNVDLSDGWMQSSAPDA